MKSLIKIKAALKEFYGRFDFAVDTAVKFIVAFAAMKLMADRLGYFSILSNKFILTIVALVCSILPWGLSTVILAICLVLHIFKASLEVAVIITFVLMTIALLYYGFQPGHAVLMILVPMFFAWKIPYVVVLIAGLSGGIMALVPVSVGVLVYYLAEFAKANAGFELGEASLTEIPGRIIKLVQSMIVNEDMWAIIIIFAVVLLVVHFLSNMSFDYSRYAALGAGAFILIIGRVAGLEINILLVLVSLIIAAAYNFIVFAVDYKKSERLQFEDDEYVYYVKAIPKIRKE